MKGITSEPLVWKGCVYRSEETFVSPWYGLLSIKPIIPYTLTELMFHHLIAHGKVQSHLIIREYEQRGILFHSNNVRYNNRSTIWCIILKRSCFTFGKNRGFIDFSLFLKRRIKCVTEVISSYHMSPYFGNNSCYKSL